MTAVAIPQAALRAIQRNLWIRNGMLPDALLQQELAQAYNQAAKFRGKEVLRMSTPIQSIPAQGADRDRWRSAFHSSPYARTLLVHFVLAPRDDSEAGSPYARLRVETSVPATVGDAEAHFAVTSSAAPDTPAYFASGMAFLQSGGAIAELPTDTDLFITVSDQNDGRLVSLTAWEIGLDADTDNGYLEQAYAAGAPILDVHREEMTEMARSLWKRGAAHTWNWSVDKQSTPRTRSSATAANLIDTAVTSVSTASPGPTFGLAYHSTIRRTTVPMAVKVRAKMSSGTGTVLLKNSSGTTLLTISVNSSTEQWWSGTVSLPAADAKYDVMFAGNGVNTLSVYAVSIYQHE